MKEYILTNAEAARVDRYTIDELGIPGIRLMEKAGSFVALKAKKILKHVPGSRVDIFCGTGNNGGDGFVAAHSLSDWGATVIVWLAGDPEKIRGDAKHFYQKCQQTAVRINIIPNSDQVPSKKELDHSDLIIDALLGTGFRGELRGVIAACVERINTCKPPVLAVDIPSGVNGDTGQIGGKAVQALRTVTMGFLKRGLLLYPGKRMCGDVVLADLGYPQKSFEILEEKTYLSEKNYVKKLFAVIPADTYKHRQGKVLVFAGSPGMTGAAVLTGMAALRAGAGLVVNAIPRSLNAIIETKLTEGLSLPLAESQQGTFTEKSLEAARERIAWSDVVVFGPGVSARAAVKTFAQRLIRTMKKPLIVDADGLRVFHSNLTAIDRLEDLIITPHIGEFAALTGENIGPIKANLIDAARGFVTQHPCTLVLKGAPTIVAAKDGTICVNSTGNPALASGGTGDVLTGMIAAFRAQGMSSFDAATAAVFTHGMAGDLGQKKFGTRSLIAGDLFIFLPQILKSFERIY